MNLKKSIANELANEFWDKANEALRYKILYEYFRWIGKRSVWTYDFRACWLEETTIDNVKSWWCGGKDADYTEIFY